MNSEKICKHTGRPFVFPDSRVQWDSLTDMTDAGQLAKQQLWAATTPSAANQGFNVTDGDVFRWKWSKIADYFGLAAAPFPAIDSPLETQMANDHAVWRQIASEHNLAEPGPADLDRVSKTGM